MDVIDSDGVNVPVSVWMQPLSGDESDVSTDTEKSSRSIVVVEPVELTEARVSFTPSVSRS